MRISHMIQYQYEITHRVKIHTLDREKISLVFWFFSLSRVWMLTMCVISYWYWIMCDILKFYMILYLKWSGRKLKLVLKLNMKINTLMLLLHLMIGNFMHTKVQTTKNTITLLKNDMYVKFWASLYICEISLEIPLY